MAEIETEREQLAADGAWAASQDWAATLQNARLLVMDGVGHFPWLDAPDRFFAATDQFLQGHWPMGVESARTAA
jgi:pimeloyl-ACP methyl ester carboxylesterase